MANTAFTEIKDRSLTLITDYDLLNLTNEELDEYLYKNMEMALDLCDFKELNYNTITKAFDREMSGYEKMGLVFMVVYLWAEAKSRNVLNYKKALSSNDFKRFAEHNELSGLLSAKNDAYSQASYYVNRAKDNRTIKELTER